MPEFVPKVLEQIYADLNSKLISETPITDTTVTSVISMILTAVALELDETYFQMFTLIKNAQLDSITGNDLDVKAAEFNLVRIPAAEATGSVTVSDTAFTKIESNVYNGFAGPVAGDTFLYTDKTTDFPSSGSLIVGRNTSNVETVTYSSIDNSSPDFTLFQLSSSFANDHGAEETVIYSQGGNRVISSGTVVQVPADDVNPEITFTLNTNVTLLDGEDSLSGIAVTASDAGTESNIPAGAIREFESPPFVTAEVTNTSQFTNGKDEESDQELRDRIRETIQTLSGSTSNALELAAIGTVNNILNNRVVSAQNIKPTVPDSSNTLYIDDGNPDGFTPTFDGQGIETVIVSAADGDRFARLDFFPIVPEILIDSSNNKINFDEGGGELTATLTSGSYSIDELLTEIKTQMESAGALTYTIVLDVRKKISIQGSGTFSILWNSGTDAANGAAKTLGFDITADDTGNNIYNADYNFRRILLKLNGTDIFPGIDYVLNPYASEIEFVTPLSSGDQVTIGSTDLRASLENSSNETFNIAPDTNLTGTVTFTQGSAAVSGAGTAFTSEVEVGDFIKLDADSGGSLTGTLTFTKGSKTVTGSGTTFTTELEVGDFIKLDADENTTFVRIASVDANDSLTLVSGYTGSSSSGASSKADPWAKVSEVTNDTAIVLEWVYPGAGGGGASGVSKPENLFIIMDSGTSQLITFLPLDFSTLGSGTAEEVTARISTNLNNADVTATSAGARITIKSLQDGSDGSVQVVGGVANDELNFSTTKIIGIDGYKYYTGLLQEVQKIINGDPDDQDTYPGVAAAGVQVEIKAPTVVSQTFSIDITTIEGVNLLSIIDEVKSATASYVNSLGIGDDVILSEIIDRIQDLTGVFDVQITSPTNNIAIADGAIAKVSDTNISVG